MSNDFTLLNAPETGGRRKLSGDLADRIRRYVIMNGLRSHDRLPQEKALIEHLGASRATVREALISLEVQGLIYNTTGPAGGARVAEASVDRAIELLRTFFYLAPVNARQLYQVRLQIEPELAVSLVGHLSPEHLQALEDNVRLQETTAISVETYRLHREAEVVFHDILAAACPNPLLALMGRFINQAIRASIDLATMPDEFGATEAFTHDNIHCHLAILKALRQGSRAKVRRLMRKHIEAAEPYVKKAMHVEPPSPNLCAQSIAFAGVRQSALGVAKGSASDRRK